MRVLLAVHHLIERAGSELYTAELATALRDAGHEVLVFTFFPGEIADDLANAGLPVVTGAERRSIIEFAPDVAHVHHSPTLYYLAGLGLGCPFVYGSLGPSAPLESAPVVWAGVKYALAVSEEVRDKLLITSFGRALPIIVFRNWFDDRALDRTTLKPARSIRRLAVISNHLDPTLARHLEHLAKRNASFEWRHYGLPQQSIKVTPDVLASFDAVVGIGRVVLQAAALGKPCLIYDVHGCDGWLAAENLNELATRNFSGRLLGARPNEDELERLIFDEGPLVDANAVAAAVWESYRLSQRVRQLEELYCDARAEPIHADRTDYGQLGRLYADLVVQIQEQRSQFSAQLDAHFAERKVLNDLLYAERAAHAATVTASHQHLKEAEHRAAEGELWRREAERLKQELSFAEERQRSGAELLELLRAHVHTLESEIEAGRREIAQLRAEIEGRNAALQELQAFAEQTMKGAGWQALRAYRAVKDRTLPHGSSQRRAYDRMLRLLKGR